MEARVMTSAAAQPPDTASKVMAYLVPTNGLWQGAVYYLEPQPARTTWATRPRG
jgi:hypothetical protein